MEVQHVQGEGCDPLLDEAVVHLWGDNGPKPGRLNREQMDAIRMAMHQKFSLIQGPPG